MVGILGILIVLFLVTLALGYKVCLMASKEKGWLAGIGIIIGLIIAISSLIGLGCTTVYLHKSMPKMGMMGMPTSRPMANPAMRPPRAPAPTTPPAVAPVPRPSTEEKK